jgi:hypothetical protein
MKVVEAYGELQSLSDELGRFTKTSGFHYVVNEDNYTIRHHGNKWVIKFNYSSGFFASIEIEAGADKLILNKNTMWLNGEQIDKIVFPGGNVLTHDLLLNLIKDAIAKWYVAKWFAITRADEILSSTY